MAPRLISRLLQRPHSLAALSPPARYSVIYYVLAASPALVNSLLLGCEGLFSPLPPAMFPLSPSVFLAGVERSAAWQLINDEMQVG